LSFGQMAIGPGKAFLLNASEDSVPIGKSWQEISDRQFLIESVLLSEAEPFLGTLQAGLSQEKKERQYASATSRRGFVALDAMRPRSRSKYVASVKRSQPSGEHGFVS